jgi:NADP-dependent 3-hydroxy acid dehydrogenase YdfG
MQRSIEGEVAWVTGAGSGIGAAAAVGACRVGAKLVLSGRRVDALEETAAAIRDGGGEAIVAPADMSVSQDVDQVAR